MRSGVYKILNVVTKKFYLGESQDIESRFAAHLRLLHSHSHFNSQLQRSFDKHGVESFTFEKIHSCPKICGITLEWILLSVCLPEDLYNIRQGPVLSTIGQESVHGLHKFRSLGPSVDRDSLYESRSKALKLRHASGEMRAVLSTEVISRRSESIRKTRAENPEKYRQIGLRAIQSAHTPESLQKSHETRRRNRQDPDFRQRSLERLRESFPYRERSHSEVNTESWVPSVKKFLRLARLARTHLNNPNSKAVANYDKGVFARVELVNCIRLLQDESDESEAVEYAEQLFAERPDWFNEVTK